MTIQDVNNKIQELVNKKNSLATKKELLLQMRNNIGNKLMSEIFAMMPDGLNHDGITINHEIKHDTYESKFTIRYGCNDYHWTSRGNLLNPSSERVINYPPIRQLSRDDEFAIEIHRFQNVIFEDMLGENKIIILIKNAWDDIEATNINKFKEEYYGIGREINRLTKLANELEKQEWLNSNRHLLVAGFEFGKFKIKSVAKNGKSAMLITSFRTNEGAKRTQMDVVENEFYHAMNK